MLKYIITIPENSAEVNEIHTVDCVVGKELSDVKILDSFNNSQDAKEYAKEIGFGKVHKCPFCCSDFLEQ